MVDQGTRGRSVKNAHHYQEDIGPEAELAIDKVERLLVAMNNLAEARGIRLVVMLFPARDQLYPENYEALVGLDIEKPQRDLTAFLRSRGIDTLDLLPALRAEKDTTQIHFDHDDHWDVGGACGGGSRDCPASSKRGLSSRRRCGAVARSRTPGATWNSRVRRESARRPRTPALSREPPCPSLASTGHGPGCRMGL